MSLLTTTFLRRLLLAWLYVTAGWVALIASGIALVQVLQRWGDIVFGLCALVLTVLFAWAITEKGK